jgi:hypothetical protein
MKLYNVQNVIVKNFENKQEFQRKAKLIPMGKIMS